MPPTTDAAGLERLKGSAEHEVRALQALANPARALIDMAAAGVQRARSDTDRVVTWSLRDGGRVSLRPATEDVQEFRRVFGARVFDHPSLDVRPGRTIVDVGAGVGLFSAYALWRWQADRVYSYEPEPAAFDVLEANAASSVDRIVPRRLAVRARVSTEEMVSCDPAQPAQWPATRLKVDTTTLAGILDGEDIATVELLRADLAGAEFEVLEAADDDLLQRVRNVAVVMARASPFDDRPEALVGRLEGSGFETTVEVETWRRCIVYAHRPAGSDRPLEG